VLPPITPTVSFSSRPIYQAAQAYDPVVPYEASFQ